MFSRPTLCRYSSPGSSGTRQPLREFRQAVGAYQIAAVCPAPWQGRPDLVTQALVLLQCDGLVLVAVGATRAWKITAADRLMLEPRRGPARERPVIGGAPHPS